MGKKRHPRLVLAKALRRKKRKAKKAHRVANARAGAAVPASAPLPQEPVMIPVDREETDEITPCGDSGE